MGFDARNAEKHGYIPAAPVRRVVEAWAQENWWVDERQQQGGGEKLDSYGVNMLLATSIGCHDDTIAHLRRGRNTWIEFDLADRIITYINVRLWSSDDELREIYQNFDFSHLDISRPTTDELSLLDGLSERLAATVMGVSQSVIHVQRSKRREKVAA